MPADAAAPDRSSPTQGPALRERELDRLILPSLRQRVRTALLFLAVSQSLYAVVLVFTDAAGTDSRAVINALRLLVLYWCVWTIRGEGSRRETLAVAGIGLAAQFAAGVLISIVRSDVLPMVLLLVALTSVSSVFIPWGGRVQAVLAVAVAGSTALASFIVHRINGRVLDFDSTVTFVVTLLVTISIASFLAFTRRNLEKRIQEARRTDEELAVLRNDLERRVADRTAELEMANRELEGFSYTVSHDLRSPLRAISGFTQMLLDEDDAPLDDAARSHLAKIRAASRHMDHLIDDMLLLARVGRGALRYEAVDLAEVARSIGEDLKAEDPDRRVVLTVNDMPAVPGDLALLRVALDNLLRNAWKFTGTREVGHVQVSGVRRGDRIVVSVKDDGIGFDPRFRGKLFQPFERIHGDPRFPGTGVGLATVARIVQRHGGDVDAEGTLDGGATFSISLPARGPD